MTGVYDEMSSDCVGMCRKPRTSSAQGDAQFANKSYQQVNKRDLHYVMEPTYTHDFGSGSAKPAIHKRGEL